MGRRKRQDDKIIHVVFGPGGGRVQRHDARPTGRKLEPHGLAREPLTDLFTRSEVSRLLGMTPGPAAHARRERRRRADRTPPRPPRLHLRRSHRAARPRNPCSTRACGFAT